MKKELKKLPAVGDYMMTGSLNELCEKIENVKTGEMNRIRSAGRAAMDLSKYDGKHVRVTDKWGETFMGMAEYVCPTHVGMNRPRSLRRTIPVSACPTYVGMKQPTFFYLLEIWGCRHFKKNIRKIDL